MPNTRELGDGLREARVSLWTVPEKWGGAFFVLLIVQGSALIAVHTWRSLVVATDAHIFDTLLVEVLVATPLLVLAGILSMLELEAALTLSVWYINRVRRQEEERQAEIRRQEAEEFEAGRLQGLEEGMQGLEEGLKDLEEGLKDLEARRQEIWEEGFAAGKRHERGRGRGANAVRERAMRYPY